MADFPLELFYQIALQLPSTKDVLNFSLTHPRVREILSTPALFKERLTLQGWDVSAWLEEDSNATVPLSPQGYLERWMHIDYVYCRTVQLLDEAAAEDYFSESPPDGNSDRDAGEPGSEQPEPEFDDITVLNPFRLAMPPDCVFLGRKKVAWLRKLSEVLPAFLTHHRGGNVSRITEARHHGALLTLARVLLLSNSTVIAIEHPFLDFGCDRALAKLVYPWFERTCLCLVALLVQCNSATSIFTDIVVYPDTSSSPFVLSVLLPDNVYGYPVDSDPGRVSPLTMCDQQLHISDLYFSTFLIQAMIFIKLHTDTSQPLRPPSLPHVNPAASFSYDEFFEPQPGTIAPFVLPQARPWLRNKLAGTPLAELLSSTDKDGDVSDGRCGRRQWAGYFTVQDSEFPRDRPTFMELYSVQSRITPPNRKRDADEYMYFRGKGHDNTGTFTLRLSCNANTGAVDAELVYGADGLLPEWAGSRWGMVTPFGMAGVWGEKPQTGWWWMWPREWSDSPATTGH